MIKVYIDANFPHQLAKGLNVLQEPLNLKEGISIKILSVDEAFGEGVKDEDWIPRAGKEDGIIITQDLHIQTTRHQRDLYQKHGLGMFFFKPPSKNGYPYWEMVRQVINRWDEMKKLIRKNKQPFAFRCTSRSSNFSKLEE